MTEILQKKQSLSFDELMLRLEKNKVLTASFISSSNKESDFEVMSVEELNKWSNDSFADLNDFDLDSIVEQISSQPNLNPTENSSQAFRPLTIEEISESFVQQPSTKSPVTFPLEEESESESKAEPKLESELELESKVESESEPESESKVELESESESKVEPELELVTKEDKLPLSNKKPKKKSPDSQPEKTPKPKKRKILSSVIFYTLIFAMIGGALLLSLGQKKVIGGYSIAEVLTTSMQRVIPKGSMVLIKSVPADTLQIGDDITYMQDEHTSVTHRIIGITENFEGSGQRGFEMQGIENNTPDFEIVPAINVVGKVIWHVSKLGSWLSWIREHLLIMGAFTVGIIIFICLLKGALKKPEEKDSPPKSDSNSKQVLA